MVNITYGEHGRGAWTKEGGLLQLDRTNNITKPGPYYMAPVNSTYMIGLDTAKKVKAGRPVDINFYATFLGVKELQKRLNAVLPGPDLVVDGILGPKTDASIKEFQKILGVTSDGMIGPKTSEAAFLPLVKATATAHGTDWRIIGGLLKTESSFDPGATGYIDTHDHGLSQINHTSHPEVSVEQAYDASFAIGYASDRFKKAVVDFKGSVRDAIASYNLGDGGTAEWIKKGRPDIWTPSWDSVPRNTKKYIDDIQFAY